MAKDTQIKQTTYPQTTIERGASIMPTKPRTKPPTRGPGRKAPKKK